METVQAATANSHEDELSATFWEHVDALRSVLIWIVCTVLIGICLALYFYSSLLHFLLSPLNSSIPALRTYEVKHQRIFNETHADQLYSLPNESTTIVHTSSDVTPLSPTSFTLPSGSYIDIATPVNPSPLALLTPLEGMKTTLKICVWIGIVFTSPIWLFLAMQFILPAIKRRQRHFLWTFLGLSLLFLSSGALFAYTITLPLANEMFYAFNAEIGMNLWSYAAYIDYTFLLMLANALAFEIALILFFLVHLGILTPQMMQTKRRVMILVAFIVGALLTPPDVLTQVMLALPLIGLYELALLYGKILNQRKIP